MFCDGRACNKLARIHRTPSKMCLQTMLIRVLSMTMLVECDLEGHPHRREWCLMTDQALTTLKIPAAPPVVPRRFPVWSRWSCRVHFWTETRTFWSLCTDRSSTPPRPTTARAELQRGLDGADENYVTATGTARSGRRNISSRAPDFNNGMTSTRKTATCHEQSCKGDDLPGSRLRGPCRPSSMCASAFQRPLHSSLFSMSKHRPRKSNRPPSLSFGKPHRNVSALQLRPATLSRAGCRSATAPRTFHSLHKPPRQVVDHAGDGRGGPKSADCGVFRRMLPLFIATTEARVSLAATAGEGPGPPGLGKHRGVAVRRIMAYRPCNEQSVKSVLTAVPLLELCSRWKAAPPTKDGGAPELPCKPLKVALLRVVPPALR